jgi:putative phosphoesterase
MKLGIVSDTHDNLDVVEAAVDVFDGRVETVIHCGDVISPFATAPFETGDFEFYAVRGNNDGEWALADAIDEFGTYLGEMGELTLDGASVAVYHGTSLDIVDALVGCGDYDYVCHGHTHQRAHETENGTTRLNPGGIALSADADGDPPAGVVLDTETGEVAFHDLR